jgi:selenide,water dikinase
LALGSTPGRLKKDALSVGDYRDMIVTVTRLNRVGAELAKNPDVHTMTDVTGFGHGLENGARFGPQAHGEGQ